MTYREQQNMEITMKIRKKIKELPPFVQGFFSSLTDQTQPLTRLGYAYDLKIFFGFLREEMGRDITIKDMRLVTFEMLQDFMAYLTYYTPVGELDIVLKNQARGKSRKLAAIRGLFKYLCKSKQLEANPADLLSFPKITDKVITTLEVDEIAKLLDEVDSGEGLTGRQKIFHEHTKKRDAAIITLLLGTGMRVSECVGIDLGHIDFETGALKITRKGGNETMLYFGDEVRAALLAYLKIREEINAHPGHEDALFLSMHRRRITTRALQNMVKKYANIITKLKNISPHKLRSTFGTQLYAETRDIYLVANVLGHADVNTTRKHYAKMDEAYRRMAANKVRLRD